MTTADDYTRLDAPAGQLSLSGPSVQAEPGHLPVRGDLAHIKLAGRFFVPHYAVPMPRRVVGEAAVLRRAASHEAEAVCTIPAGTVFDVLDISGGWAWGQLTTERADAEGDVGYLEMTSLEASAP